MGTVRTTLIACVAITVGTVSSAQAVKWEYRGSIKDHGYMPQLRTTKSFYLRGDIGYGSVKSATMNEDATGLLNRSLTSVGSGGYGIGYNFTRHIRGDVTLDMRGSSDVHGYRQYPATPPRPRDFALRSTVLMANMYYDFRERSHFTPYIGLGLGVAKHVAKVGRIVDAAGAVGNSHYKEKWSTAAAFMAGGSVNLSNAFNIPVPGMHFDVGYRFLYLGDAATGVLRTAGGQVARSIGLDDITAHELRVGLRYEVF
jgi:opacity protein-like surface antigen